jgi:hypothetical protein
MVENELIDISHTIQLAVAPVFLLTGISSLLGVLTTRLSRVIDRARFLETGFPGAPIDTQKLYRTELDTLSRRGKCIYVALTCGVGSALAICLLIMLAFVGYLYQTKLGVVVAVLFIIGLFLLVIALMSFLREVFFSVESLRFGLQAVVQEEPR